MTLAVAPNPNGKVKYTAYPFGTKVKFGPELQGEIVSVHFAGTLAQVTYLVEWWEVENGVQQVELYEEQLRVVR